MKNLCSGTHRGGFQFLLILNLWGISFHVVIVFVLGKNLLFKSVLGHCARFSWLKKGKNLIAFRIFHSMTYSFTKHVIIFFHQFHFFAPTLRSTFCVYVLHTFFWQFLLFDSHFRLLLILVKRLMVLTIQFSLFFPHHLQPFTVFQYEASL